METIAGFKVYKEPEKEALEFLKDNVFCCELFYSTCDSLFESLYSIAEKLEREEICIFDYLDIDDLERFYKDFSCLCEEYADETINELNRKDTSYLALNAIYSILLRFKEYVELFFKDKNDLLKIA